MTLIKFLSLRSRFLIAPIIAGVLMMSLYVFQNYEFDQNKNKLTELQKSNLPIVGEISQISILMAKNQNDLRTILDLARKNKQEALQTQRKQVLEKLYEIELKFQRLMQKDFQNPMQPFIKELFSIYSATVVETANLAETNQHLAEQKLAQVNESLGEVNQLLTGLSNHFITQLTIKSVQLDKSVFSTWMPLLILLTIGLTILAGLLISNRMSVDLNMYTNALKHLSSGNHEVDTPASNDPYFVDLQRSVKSFKQALQKNQKQKVSLEESHNRYETLLNFIPTAIIALDSDHKIMLFNNAAETIFKFRAEQIIGEPISTLIPDIHHDTPIDNDDSNIIPIDKPTKEVVRNPLDAIRKSGEHFLIEMSRAKLQVSSEELTTFAITDVTARHEAEEKIWHQAHYDALTGLPNRLFSINSLENTLRLAERNQQKVAVLFIDLDNFKRVNDTLGHSTGDTLLIEAAERLSSQVRQTDLVGRLGGDEFVIILTELNQEADVQITLDKLLKTFRKPIFVDEQEVSTTLSIGVSTYPRDALTTDELLKKADIAMYHAKKNGRNGYSMYQGDMHERIQRRIVIENQLNNALNNGEFLVYYQCQHESKSQNVIGAEALIRWNNPELGNIAPNEFIPIAEQTGQIISIGEFVLREAVKQLRQWHDDFPENKLTVSVNLSPVQFRDPKLLDKIDTVLEEQSMPARYLNLEITEGILMSGHLATAELLKNMKKRGLTISIDDFGTGYSSLSYLQKFSFDSLKIDRTFVKNCIANPSDQHLIKAIIAMAHALDLKVVVEGVETEEQLEFMVNAKGDSIQGFYFCKPAPAEELNLFSEKELAQAIQAS